MVTKENIETALELTKELIQNKIEELPHHYDEELADIVYDSTSEVDKWLQLSKVVREIIRSIDYSCDGCYRQKSEFCSTCKRKYGDKYLRIELGDKE